GNLLLREHRRIGRIAVAPALPAAPFAA
ncbi:MAG: hypothetical protein QOG50_1041, partial [Actinomycetota bacterium]|nr:hypothetical protein [Actinomycetota bacterium]